MSIDLEFLWGVWDKVKTEDVSRCASQERYVVNELLALLAKYEIPATWAFVARLLDDSNGFDGLRGERENWYAPDVIDSIRSQRVEHELGTHSYSHIYFGESSREAVREDLFRAKAVHKQHGLPFCSFVFPRNQVAHLDVVAEVGIQVFRSVDSGMLAACDERLPRARPLVNLMEKALPLPPPVVRPIAREHGLVETPSSLLLIGRSGLRRVVSSSALRAKLKMGLEKAVTEQRLFHLWFHPSNFYYQTDKQLRVLESVLMCAARLRDDGVLNIVTMRDYADL
ncbi:MAG: polysaccharide deacetylase family protein [Acidimicrobiia bacterium]